MSDLSSLHAPVAFKTARLRSAFDIAALVAVVLVVALAAHLASVRPYSSAPGHAGAAQEGRR